MANRNFRNEAVDTNEAAAEQKQKNGMFLATITPASIERGIGKNDQPYIALKGATVETKKRGANTRTVMVFGKVVDAVSDKLAEGQPIDLAVVPNGGTLNALGLAWTEEERAAYKAQRQAA